MSLESLTETLSAKAGIPKSQASELIRSIFEQIGASLEKGERVALPGFGAFTVGQRAARTGRNPRTGEPIQIAAKKTIKFSAASALEKSVNP